jgi:hypothetical protein
MMDWKNGKMDQGTEKISMPIGLCADLLVVVVVVVVVAAVDVMFVDVEESWAESSSCS